MTHVTPHESLLRTLVEIHPDDAARSLELLDAEDAKELFRTLPESIARPLLERIRPQVLAPLLVDLEVNRICELLISLPPRAASVIVIQLEPDKRELVFEGLPEQVRRPLQELTKYGPDTAGSIMEPRVPTLSLHLTASQAISAVRQASRKVLHYIYVADSDGKLVGVVNMRDLLLAKEDSLIDDIVHRDVVSVTDTMDRTEAVNLLTERRLLAIPVIDYEGRMLGVVKHDAAMTSSQLVGFQDLQKIAGAAADERALSSVSTVVRSRLPWLTINLVTAFMAAAVVGMFEGIIAQVAALAVLMPVVAGQGGNTGAQSLAIVIRGIAIREIIHGAEMKVIKKELYASIINGIVIAIMTAVAVFAWQYLMDGSGLTKAIGLSSVIFLSMIINMVAAAFAGTVIPLALKSLGRDPAQSSSIFLTTVTDIVGFSSFLGFAVLFLPMLT